MTRARIAVGAAGLTLVALGGVLVGEQLGGSHLKSSVPNSIKTSGVGCAYVAGGVELDGIVVDPENAGVEIVGIDAEFNQAGHASTAGVELELTTNHVRRFVIPGPATVSREYECSVTKVTRLTNPPTRQPTSGSATPTTSATVLPAG